MLQTVLIYILSVILTFVVAYLIMPVAEKMAVRIGAIDKPNSRKVHSKPIPRLGGLGIFLAFNLIILTATTLNREMVGVLLGAAVVFAAGVWDDARDLPPWVKLAAQLLGAAIAVYSGLRVHVMTNPFDGVIQLGYLSVPLTLLWIIGVTNAINLIDGLDGLAAGVSVIAAVTIGIVALRGQQEIVAYIAFVLAGGILGFLPYNIHPARMFMGDSGAMFLGFMLACLSIAGMAKGAAIISLGIPVVILGIPVFDTLFAIIRRVNNKSNIFDADKAHLHHRLMAMGCSHRQSVAIIYIISIVLGGVAVVLTYVTSPQAVLILAAVLVLIVIGGSRIGIVSAAPEKEDAKVYIKESGISKGV